MSPEIKRKVQKIRNHVKQYRRRNRKWVRECEVQFNAYRFQFERDRSWYQESEPIYRERLKAFELNLGPNDWTTASATVGLADILYKNGKLEEAGTYLGLALDRFLAVSSMPEHYRKMAVDAIQLRIGCNESARRTFGGRN